MAEQNARQPTVQHFKAGQTRFFKWKQISNKGDQEETNGAGTHIHCGPSKESNQELEKEVKHLAQTNSAFSTWKSLT